MIFKKSKTNGLKMFLWCERAQSWIRYASYKSENEMIFHEVRLQHHGHLVADEKV